MSARNPAVIRREGEGKHGPARTHAPSGFATDAPNMSRRELSEKYSVGGKTVARWLEEEGVRTKPVVRSKIVEAARRARSRPTVRFRAGADRPLRDITYAGQAADYLRRFGPVIRCDDRGRFNLKGDHWRRGSTILRPDDVVERARRNGWRPEAWAEISA